jgi:hypothetical protein
MDDLLCRINGLFENPRLENIAALFEYDGYIRLNRVYISPFSIRQLKVKLTSMEMVSWQIGPSGLFFQFRAFRLKFYGSVNVVVRHRIFCVEIDFDPNIDDNMGMLVLKELETYLKSCDAIFFMTYFSDIDREILHNPLSDSIEFMYKKTPLRK